MDHVEAVAVLLEAARARPDGRALEALGVVLGAQAPLPPSAMGRLGGSAAALAKHVHKTGRETAWRTPAPDSKGMEHLVHRMTLLFEDFLSVWEESHSGKWGQPQTVEVKAVWAPGMVQGTAVDETYQRAYCDDCGAELAPDGTCAVCSTGKATELPF